MLTLHGMPKNISSQRNVKLRSMKSVSKEEPPDLDFVWDHYKRESDDYDEEGFDALDNMFGETPQEPTHNIPKSIADDIVIFRETGFNIDYPNGRLGEGFYGVVYRGHYGSAAPNNASSRFAVKVIDFGQREDLDTLDKRERFETEKYILTYVNHPNIISVRMIINSGEIGSFPFTDLPSERFLSPERVYLIMDFSDGGELETWLQKNYKHMAVAIRVDLIRDLFAGMLYLHSENIVHGDVHTGNVLIFNRDDGVVAKWSDFGLGFVGSNKQYRYRKPKPQDMQSEMLCDIQGMYSVYYEILTIQRQNDETPEEKQLMKELFAMNKVLNKAMNYDKNVTLSNVYQQFKHILEDELILDEQHYQ